MKDPTIRPKDLAQAIFGENRIQMTPRNAHLFGWLLELQRDAALFQSLRVALRFYAGGEHFIRSDASAWDTVSGEPQNWFCDEAGTATVEDGTIAARALRGEPIDWNESGEDCTPQPIKGEAGQ